MAEHTLKDFLRYHLHELELSTRDENFIKAQFHYDLVESINHYIQNKPFPAAVDVPVRSLDDGKLWSWVRRVLSQGGTISGDYANQGYEKYSARLDAAAQERTAELLDLIAAAPSPSAGG